MAVLVSLSAGCEKKRTGFDFAQLDARLMAIIQNPQSPDEELRGAIDHLGKPHEDPELWSGIANNPRYSISHRRRCVVALLRRHGRSIVNASMLAEFLGRPTWLADDHIAAVGVVAGNIPVRFDPGDTIFQILLFPKPGSPKAVLYVRMCEPIDRDTFSRVLRSELGAAKARTPMFVEIGVYDESDTER